MSVIERKNLLEIFEILMVLIKKSKIKEVIQKMKKKEQKFETVKKYVSSF